MTTAHTTSRRVGHVVLGAGILLMVPLVAMQITDQVVWSLADFAVAATLLVGTGLMYVLAAGRVDSLVYRAAVGVALGTALFLVWVNLAVGLIGSEQNRANLMYIGVLAVGFVGAAVARMQPRGMARALFATALAQAMVGGLALFFRLGGPSSPPLEILATNGLFVALFTGSGVLFRRAARAPRFANAPADG